MLSATYTKLKDAIGAIRKLNKVDLLRDFTL